VVALIICASNNSSCNTKILPLVEGAFAQLFEIVKISVSALGLRITGTLFSVANKSPLSRITAPDGIRYA
jgi:hypothetical protein